jgi:hypothetical protein
MVMPQVPALFLPKKKIEENNKLKNSNKSRKKKESDNTKKVSALVKGRIDGYEKNNIQVRSGTNTG